MELAGVVFSNIAIYGAQRVLDLIASICGRLCHRYVGRLLGDTDNVGRRGRSSQTGGGQVAGTRVAGTRVAGTRVVEAQDLVDVEAQVNVGDPCVVSLGCVAVSTRDLSMNMVATECEV